MKNLKYISFSPFLFALLTFTTVSYFVALNIATFLYKQVFNRSSGKPFCQRRCRNEKPHLLKRYLFSKKSFTELFLQSFYSVSQPFSAQKILSRLKNKVIIYNRCPKYSFLSKFRGRLKKVLIFD